MFTPKDRLSNRYFHKRAHYLAVIASSLLERAKSLGKDDVWKGVQVEWEYMGGDGRRPVLVVTLPKGQSVVVGCDDRHDWLIPKTRPLTQQTKRKD